MNIKFYTLIFTSLFLFSLVQNSFAQIPQNGLVGNYMLDGNAADSSGMNNHGVIIGQINPIANRFGQIDKAYSFEGGYIDLGNPQSLQLNDSMSIATWFNLSEITRWSGLVTNWSSVDGGYFLGVNPNDSKLRWNIGSDQLTNGDSAVTAGEWIHVAVTYDGSSIKLYQNSILIDSAATIVPIGSNAFNVLIGSQSNIVDGVFVGAIDDVLIYNRGLSQGEIESIFNATVSSTQNTFIDRSVVLSPNPTNSILKIRNNSEHQILSYTLCNAAGMRLKTAAFQEELDISNQSSGVYYLILNFEDGSMTKKVVKL